jgi:altronate dehydratase small subunit
MHRIRIPVIEPVTIVEIWSRKMERKILVRNKKDNVAVAIADLEAGERLAVDSGEEGYEIVAKQAIDIGHKIAIKDIEKDEDIIKSGEVIGFAVGFIKTGDHVHVHNVQSKRGGV